MTPEATTLWLREHEYLPGKLLTHEQAVRLREHFGDYLDVTRAFDGEGYDLKANGYVGVIVLPGLTIRIDSKVPADNLFYMLSYAYDLPSPFRAETTALDAGDSLLEFVAAIFVGGVDKLVRQGIARGYIDREEEGRFLRGRLLVNRQIRHASISPTYFHQRTNEFTADLLENRILRATLALLMRHYYRKPGLRVLLRRALSAFSEVAPAWVKPADCDRVVYTRLNRRYEPSIRLARLLLDLLSPESRAGPTSFPAFLLPMHNVFEKFAANYLREALAGRPEWRVEAQKRIHLDENRLEWGDPDLVLYHNNAPVLIIDTKYKEYGKKPKPEDRNQMFAYCRAMGVHQGMLLYPNDDARADYRQLLGDVRLALRPVSLGGGLAAFRQRWSGWVEELVMELGEPGAALLG